VIKLRSGLAKCIKRYCLWSSNGNASDFDDASSERGFALLEVIVALVIMALVGIMAWRGMDAMIRGRETIDRRANQDASYSQLVRQFERDCQEILRRDELMALSSASVSGSTSATTSLAAGAKNIWWLRRYRADNQDAWMVVGYGMSPAGLQRWTSRPLLRRNEAGSLWSSISRDPDLNSSDLLVSLEVPAIVRQSFRVQTSIVNGSGSSGISASGTGTPAANASTTSTTNLAGNNTSSGGSSSSSSNAGATPSNPSSAVTNVYPDQQGVVMQWWIKDITLPITRSCLMGGAL